ncbi:hypothetical protein NG799_10895 [Laspinema sp. D1]|uniref:Uncharacterized protein n=1 Tax=Laspinema palackyanum D2a TaxID=2953684 RepID=A0ABT2MSG8_9CYAN|nr:hypothetical protein [Laspinema sp. D2a]
MIESVKNYGEEPGDRSRLAGLKPLGIQNPFLPHQPLGQQPFESQFLAPIARESLTSFELEPAIAPSHEETVEEPKQFQEERPGESLELTEIAIATRGGQPLGQWHSIGDRSTQVTICANPSFQLPLTLSVEEIPVNVSELSALTPFNSPPLDLGIAATTDSMPTAWTNLEDLLTQTAQIDTDGEFVLTPWGVQRDSPPEPRRDRSPVPAQNPPDYPDPRSREVTITAPGYGPTPEPENLEILARKVYDLIKQRLTIDRERNGGRYSRRSPW